VQPGIGNVALTVRTPGDTETKYTTTQTGEVINRIIEAAGFDEASSTDAITSVPLRLVDGTRMVKTFNADTGLGSQVLIPADETITTPGGRTRQVTFEENKLFEDTENLLTATFWQNFATLNGKVYETFYDRKDRTVATQSPLGRVTTTVMDEDGRTTDTEAPGFGSTHFDYDKFGRVIATTRTAGNETRTRTYAYDDSDGFMRSVIDALDQKTNYEPDIVGRLLGVTDPSGARFEQTLDSDNRLKLVTLPGNKQHFFDYKDPSSLLQLVTPPRVDGPSSTDLRIGNVRYTYNKEDFPTLIERSDGNNLELVYDDAKRVKTLTTSGVALNYTYDRAGRPTRIARSDGPTLDTEFDGALLTRMEWTGPIEGKVTADYDADFRLSQLTVNDASTASYDYDDDGAIISATANQQTLTVDYDGETGLALGTNLGNVSTSLSHNAFGELNGLSATFQGKVAFTQDLERDALGRIVQLDETLGNIETTTLYTYDGAGRLETVTRGNDVTTYQYDENGNRLAIQVNGAETVAAEYDAQDRLVSHSDLTFEQTEHGDLLRRTGPEGALELAYDGLGNLLTANAITANASKVIDYTIDGLGRRVGKQIGGKFSRAWLYRDQLRPAAEITDAGVFTHFVYASDAPGAPDFMLRAGVPFRIIKDHLGSVRVVVNAQTGIAAQLIDYDEFGNVMRDTTPGFQPFGFAGGLYDPDTSLVRFGARDYDASVGRWVAKDPLSFEGDQTNLYVYASGDPVNNADHTGLFGDFLGWTVSAGSPFAPIVGALFGKSVPSGAGASVGIFKDFDFSTLTLSLGFYSSKAVSIDAPGRVKKGVKGTPFFLNLGTEFGLLKSLDAFKGTSTGGVVDLGLGAGTVAFSGGSKVPATVGGNVAVGAGAFFGLTRSDTGIRGISIGLSGIKIIR
jgi:RHS repeat-associated protein